MKATRAQIERALDAGPASEGARLFLLHGPDESQSRELAQRLTRAMGADAERIDLTGAQLKGDPARLSDEAGAIALFGGARHIRVEPVGDESLDAIEALLEAPAGGNPVVLIAGTLRKDSKLLKLALGSPAVLAFAAYAPEGGDADRLAIAMARELGLRVRPDVARRLASASGGDRALLARELEKLALYADASPERPAKVEHDTLDALGAAVEDGDLARMVDAALGGDAAALDEELARLADEGVEGIAVIRALLRRLLMLASLRAEMAAGNSIATVVDGSKSLFWKDKPAVSRQLALWPEAAIATAVTRLAATERALKASGAVGAVEADMVVLGLTRAVARRR